MRNHPRLAITLVALAMVLAGCQVGAAGSGGPGGPLGFDNPPPGTDPNSPKVASLNVAFDRKEIGVPAGRAFVLVYQNQEKLPHNVSIYRDAAHKDRFFEGIVFEGPSTRWYPVPALAPGTYFFQCDVHPIEGMQGTLTAGP